MKIIITLLSLTLVALAIQAQTTYVIHVDDVSHVASLTKDGEELTFDADNNATIEVSAGEEVPVVITTADPWVLSNDSYEDGGWGVSYLLTYFGNNYEFYFNGYSPDTNYYFVTVDNNEIRKNTATINIIDDPSKVSMWNYYSYMPQYFTENVNTYRFMDEESKIVISSVDSSYYLYKVLHNDEEVEWGYNFELTLADGDEVDVYTEWPDEDVTVTFELQGDACNKSFIYALVNNQTITDFSQPVVAKMGQIIDIDVAYINYTTDLFTVNGEPQEVYEWGAQYSCLLTEDLVIVLKQTKKECYTSNVTVNDCSLIRYAEGLVRDLKPTGNTFTVEVAKDQAWNYPVYFFPVDYTTQIESCTVDGIPAEYDEVVSAFYVVLTEDTKEIVINASQSVEVVFHVDDPSHVKSMIVADQAYQFDNEGNLTVNATEYCQWTLSTIEPYVISAKSSYMDYYSGGDVYQGSLYTDYKSEYTNDVYVYDGGPYKTEYNIVTVDKSVIRPYSAQINIIGDPSKVRMWNDYSYKSQYFTENVNTYRFMDEESKIAISSVDSNYNLYKVLHNDEEVERGYNFEMTLADGDEVDVYTDWPDKDVTVTFELQGDACNKSFTEACIDYQTITDFSHPVVAKMGQTIDIYVAYINYTTDLFTVNGVEQKVDEWGAQYSGLLTEDLAIVLKQTKKECYTANVTVNDCSLIRYNEACVDNIKPTSNTFTVEVAKDQAQDNPVLFYPVDYATQLDECLVDGIPAKYNEYDRAFRVDLTEDTKEIVINASHIERPYMFSFYFNSPQKASSESADIYALQGWWMSCEFPGRESEMMQSMKAGYNFIDFGNMDGQFQFGLMGDEADIDKNAHLYYNNAKQASPYYRAPFLFYPQDGDIFKVYITEGVEPSFYTATFAVEDDAAVLGAYTDGINEFEVKDKTERYELQETGFTLLLADGYIVKLDGEEIEPMEEPVLARSEEGTVYYFDLVKDLKVEILKGESGISTIADDDNAADNAVYNILGVKVSNGSTDNLPAGLYLQKGQKF